MPLVAKNVRRVAMLHSALVLKRNPEERNLQGNQMARSRGSIILFFCLLSLIYASRGKAPILCLAQPNGLGDWTGELLCDSRTITIARRVEHVKTETSK
jgi:hypothetical protein